MTSTHLFPPIEPFAVHRLPVSDGHILHVEECGRPDGEPLLVVHGGPGSGRSETARRYADPARYRIILFDQRGCGRSRPLASDVDFPFGTVTTGHMVDDIEAIRHRLAVERWTILAGSWGVTLALAAAQARPNTVKRLVLHSVATTTRPEIDWIVRGVGRFLPEAYERFVTQVGGLEGFDLLHAYHRQLTSDDRLVADSAARAWSAWEHALVADEGVPPHPRFADAVLRLGFARLVTHVWRHAAWLEDDHLLSQMGELKRVPGTLIHGRRDLGSPVVTAWRLHQAWAASRLTVVADAGHDMRQVRLVRAVMDALAG